MKSIQVKVGTTSEIILYMRSLCKLTANHIGDEKIETLSNGDLFEVSHRTIERQIYDALNSNASFVTIALNRAPVGTGHYIESFKILETRYIDDSCHDINDSVKSKKPTVTISEDLTYWK